MWVLLGADVEDGLSQFESKLGKEGGFADAWLTSEEKDATSSKAITEDAIEFTNICFEVIVFLGSESLGGFDGQGGCVCGAIFAATGFGETSGFDQSVPFVTYRALTGPFGELIATGVAHKD